MYMNHMNQHRPYKIIHSEEEYNQCIDKLIEADDIV